MRIETCIVVDLNDEYELWREVCVCVDEELWDGIVVELSGVSGLVE